MRCAPESSIARSEVQPTLAELASLATKVPRRAEQVPSGLCLDGASQGGRGTAGEWKRDRRNVEQGPQLQVGDATRDQTQRDRPPPSTAFEVRSPKKTSGPLFHSPAVPLPPYDAPSKHTTLGTCSALRGTLCRSACQYRHIGCTSLRVITNSGSNARVFHRARGSHTDG